MASVEEATKTNFVDYSSLRLMFNDEVRVMKTSINKEGSLFISITSPEFM